ncbi:uncharacterized protein FA14DRAFT_33732 [Meira miltonrushii]|uniref:N-acetyltransferase domain-containing protein n=1 Tax=Meira miltonrushii TaxID=1280837 RepID=A0A316VFF3_9BASI|nr:uncharacterized protein FA14DRAFT_33732 [Meira miltonrushii]PWN34751.1 hypothetical protein FA14DRAFT_33732 [Meira miltonrushii]
MTTEDTFPFEIVAVPWNDCNAVKLRQMQHDEFYSRYPEDPGEPGKSMDAEDCLLFLLIRQQVKESNEVKYVAAAGLRKVDDSRAEVKRMFVIPEARGPPFRLGERLISSLEQHAQQFGFDTLLVETGSFNQQALRFYHRIGFSPCAAFPPYEKAKAPLSVFLEKKIVQQFQ